MAKNRQLSEAELERRIEQLAAVNSVSAMVSQSLDLDKTLDAALEAVMRVISVEATGISLLDHEAGELVLRAQRGWRRDFVEMGMRIPLGTGLSGYVIDNDEVVVTGDVSDDPRIAVPAFAQEGIQAQALVPMHARGSVVGILSALSYSPHTFSEDEIDMLRAVADQIGVALDNARLFGQVAREQSKLRAVLNSTAEAILAVDAASRLMLVNETLCRWFDIEEASAVGSLLPELGLPEVISARIVEAMEDQTPASVTEVPMDNERTFALHITHLVGEQEQEEGWVVVLHDVTHFKDMEQIKSRIIQTAAHDLMNPLHVTESALDMLAQDYNEPTRSQLRLNELAMRGIKRMRALIDDMLQLERIESGVDMQLKSIDIGGLVNTVIEENQLAAYEKSQTLAVKVPSSLPYVVGQATFLQSAIENLVGNAIKYTGSGGNIEVRLKRRKNFVHIEVADNGRGIPKETHSRLWERFFRVTTDEDDTPGTGLGLAIVKSVAEQHGGQVWVSSTVGEGSTFGFSVPVAE